MSSLAAITKNMGYNVSGSDRTESEITDRLASEGIDVKYFHAAENVNGASLVVYTAAVRKDNPELAEAQRAAIPLCSRADYLGWLMSGCRERIGIAGTHGKSTVTSMISEIFMSAGLDPTGRQRSRAFRHGRRIPHRRKGIFHFRGVRVLRFLPLLPPPQRRS